MKSESATQAPAPGTKVPLKKSNIELMAEGWLEELTCRKALASPEAVNNLVYVTWDAAVKVLPEQNMQYDLEGFVALVDLLKEMEGHISSTELLTLGNLIMMKRPYCPNDLDRNKPVEGNDSTHKVIELFGLLSKHAVDGFDSSRCVNVAHLLRQVLTQNAHSMTVEQMRPFLEISPKLTWHCKEGVTQLGLIQRPEPAFFQSQPLLSTRNIYTVPNQAWVALLHNSFPDGTNDCSPADVLTGEPAAERFDQVTRKIIEIAKAGVKMEMRRTDVILIAQILERMTHVVTVEAGTERADFYASAVPLLIGIVLPTVRKINSRNCIFSAVGIKKNPMCDDGFFNTCALRSLKAAVMPLGYPAATEALERLRYQVLLHTVEISPVLKKFDDYDDDEYIVELADLCTASLMKNQSLASLNEAGKLHLVRLLKEGPVRRHLMTENMKVRKELFIEDLGL